DKTSAIGAILPQAAAPPKDQGSRTARQAAPPRQPASIASSARPRGTPENQTRTTGGSRDKDRHQLLHASQPDLRRHRHDGRRSRGGLLPDAGGSRAGGFH